MEFISLLIHCLVCSSVTIEFILVSYERKKVKKRFSGFLRSSLNCEVKAITKKRSKPVQFYNFFLWLWFNRNCPITIQVNVRFGVCSYSSKTTIKSARQVERNKNSEGSVKRTFQNDFQSVIGLHSSWRRIYFSLFRVT